MGKLNMLAQPMTFGSLSWGIRYSVLAKPMSCCEVEFFRKVLGRGQERTKSQVPKYYSLPEVQWKQSWFYEIGGNQMNSRHALSVNQGLWALFMFLCPFLIIRWKERRKWEERKEMIFFQAIWSLHTALLRKQKSARSWFFLLLFNENTRWIQ